MDEAGFVLDPLTHPDGRVVGFGSALVTEARRTSDPAARFQLLLGAIAAPKTVMMVNLEVSGKCESGIVIAVVIARDHVALTMLRLRRRPQRRPRLPRPQLHSTRAGLRPLSIWVQSRPWRLWKRL